MRGVLSLAPFDLVDLFFYFQGFQIIKFRLMRLELRVELVLAGFLLPTVSYSERATKNIEGLGRWV